MASRTNKRGIAAKKQQIKKQADRTKGQTRFNYPKRKLGVSEGKELSIIGAKENPKGHTYNRFLKGRKVCYETRMRIDPDGYRLVKLPSGGLDFVEVPISGWAKKNLSKMKGIEANFFLILKQISNCKRQTVNVF